MKLQGIFKPKPAISEEEKNKGLRLLAWEGSLSLGFNSITTSGFLAAFALALGANNLQIGILAAIPFLMQIVQIPTILLVEKIRLRKIISIVSSVPGQLLWVAIALIPFFVKSPSAAAISLLLWLMAARYLLNAATNAAWNSWIRDLIPQTMLGNILSRRLIFATTAAVLFGLGAALFVDYWPKQAAAGSVIMSYTYVLLFGAVFLGLVSPVIMSFMPEPLMPPVSGQQASLWKTLSAPIRDGNFRRLIQFLFSWAFASNLAIPFFAVYMLKRLEFPLTWVIALTILSQFFNIFFLKVWGRFVDRFGNKVVLSLCASLYLLVILSWIFTTMPERYFLTIPLLVVLHIFAGIANAGVTLAMGTIGLKLSPKGEATSYLVGASLATNMGAGLGPLVGGYLADFFATRQINLTLTWIDPAHSVQLPALRIIGYDFLFGIAFIIGVFTLGVLARIREEGEVGREVILESLFYPTREISRPMSSVPGYNLLANFPLSFLKKVPIPGIDVAVGVTTYQIAEIARVAASVALGSKRVTRKLVNELGKSLSGILKDKEEVKTRGTEIVSQATRGALHAADNTPLAVENLVLPVTTGMIEVANKAGINPLNGISGVTQGAIQGAVETGADLGAVTKQIMEAVRKVAEKSGVPEEAAVTIAAEGILEITKTLKPEAFTQVKDALATDKG